MTSIDGIILGVLAFFFLLGFSRGLIRQAGALIGFFFALWVASKFYLEAAVYLKPYLATLPFIGGPVANIVAFIILLVATSAAMHILVAVLDTFFRLAAIIPLAKLLNHLGGAVVGLAEGVFFVSAIIFVMFSFPLSTDIKRQTDKSIMIPPLKAISTILTPLMPDMSKLMVNLNPTELLKDIKLPTGITPAMLNSFPAGSLNGITGLPPLPVKK